MFDECLYFNATKFTRLINFFWAEAYRPIGLSPSHAYLLQFILNQPGETLQNLAEKMDLKLSTVTRFVDVLSAKGLVERRKENKDKRECSVYPTIEGKELKTDLDRTSKILRKEIRKILGDKSVSDTVSLLKKFSIQIKIEKERGNNA
ncbi:MAG: winged helix-turn-helix transcriptional regulator [Gammaproteobacteria bacterium]|nr:winged helix-turn-helix transcriptional regulator [Gammaproteobacteria bacterium]